MGARYLGARVGLGRGPRGRHTARTSWLGRRSEPPGMPAAAPEGPPAALSLAEKAVCKVVYGAPRPRPLLLPGGLELWLYVQKMRDLRGKRCGGQAGGQATCRGGGGAPGTPLPGASAGGGLPPLALPETATHPGIAPLCP